MDERGLPVAVQVCGRRHDDHAMLELVAEIERAQSPVVDQCQGSDGRLRNPYLAALAASQR